MVHYCKNTVWCMKGHWRVITKGKKSQNCENCLFCMLSDKANLVKVCLLKTNFKSVKCLTLKKIHTCLITFFSPESFFAGTFSIIGVAWFTSIGVTITTITATLVVFSTLANITFQPFVTSITESTVTCSLVTVVQALNSAIGITFTC